ncbi:GMC oxidoreductase [Hymenobacter rigui]|uniref:GMC family oxidoreductase n=1 Tax=Hymenobacter rigui TaxID=334424 RepID=A0A3R9NW96_9BACT|nr:GMC oxidoreductase [Hymenobacter rigui]RSK43176.1 GMC family oxidoreductase [Hymenobacter rigui]
MKTFSSSPNLAFGYPTPGPQTPTPQKVMDHIFFLSEEAWKDVREQEQFDYIIIGSGFCALAFAERVLTQMPMARILILERGPFFLPEHFQNLPIPYQRTLGHLSETFPWTLSARTATQPQGNIQFQHGMVPFFGGRSIMWSAWCPRPTLEEMQYWPEHTVAAARAHFASAEKLLNVIPADEIDQNLSPKLLQLVAQQRPVYSVLQRELQAMLSANLGRIPSATRVMAAPLAVGSSVQAGIDFAKFSTPSVLLDLVSHQADLQSRGEGNPLKIAGECIVHQIYQQDGVATALNTSRGVVNIGSAKLILAMGTVPPATLLMNSFPNLEKVGERFTAHFITSVVARIPRQDYAFAADLEELELAAIYLAGVNPTSGMQYHVQLSVLSDRNPLKNASMAARYMPDVVATASLAQLTSSEDYLVFVCAVLGEMDFRNPDNYIRLNGQSDPTTNINLQAIASETDLQTWDTMDEGTFQMLEQALSPIGSERVEYWHGTPTQGSWRAHRPAQSQRRVGGLVHEGSPLWIGEGSEGVVGLDYRPHGIENVYVTGGALWPASGSWNPTMTMVALAQDLADNLVQESEQAPAAALNSLENTLA